MGKVIKKFDEVKKKHSRTSPEVQFKELNEKPRSNLILPAAQMNNASQNKQNHLK